MPPPVIIVLGAGLEHRQLSDPPRLWIGHQTRLRAEAAGKVWKDNAASLILCSGGRTAPHTPSEAESMKDFLTNSPWNIPYESILTENDSIETAENVRNAVTLLQTKGISTESVILVAGRRHIHRAARYFMAYGIRVEERTACSILGIQPEFVTFRDQVHETILTALQIIDRKGCIPTWIKRRGRKT